MYARILGNQLLDNLVDIELVRKYATLMQNENGVVTIIIDFTKLDKSDLLAFKVDNVEKFT